jgi:DNA-binding transcriptional ArsR family regulator
MNPIYDRVGQILAELGDTPEARAQIAMEAQAAGISAGELAAAISTPENTVSEEAVLQAAEEAGQAFAPPSSGIQTLPAAENTISLGGIGDLAPSNITLGSGGSSVTVGGGGSGVTVDTSVPSTPVSSGNGVTIGGGGSNIDLTGGNDSSVTVGGGSGVTVDTSVPSTPVNTGGNNIDLTSGNGSSVSIGDGSGVTVDPSVPSTPVNTGGSNIDLTGGSGSSVTVGDGSGVTVGPSVPGLSNLTTEQLAFAQTLPVNLQDDYVAAVGAGLGDPASGATLPSLAELLRDRGLTFEEASQTVGLTPEMENYSDAVRSFYNVQPLAPPPLDVSTLTPEQISLIESQYNLQPIPVPQTVDLSSLTTEQQAFAQTLPADLQDDYIAAIGAGLGDPASGATIPSIAELLRDRGLTFSEAAAATGLTPENENYADSVRAFYQLNQQLTPGGLEMLDYASEPGGVFGPGQAVPNIPDSITGAPVPMSYTPFTQAAPGGTQPAAQPTTLFSPGISTYAQQPAAGVTYSYPQPFGDIDIFNRTNPTGLTAYTPPPTTTTT